MKNQLKCPVCNDLLRLKIAFSGCDWDSEAGEGSNHNYPMSLDCTNEKCAHTYTLGYLKDPYNFSSAIEKPYKETKGYI